jgi:hypothetical protein
MLLRHRFSHMNSSTGFHIQSALILVMLACLIIPQCAPSALKNGCAVSVARVAHPDDQAVSVLRLPPTLEQPVSGACTWAARWAKVQAGPVLLRWYVWTGRWGEAVRVWTDVLQESGTIIDHLTAAEAYSRTGNTALALGEWARGKAVPLILVRAAALLSQGQVSDAAQVARIAIQVAPDNGETYRVLAYTYWTSGDLESFVRWGQEALRRGGISRADRLMLAGQVATVEQNWPVAEQAFATLSELWPDRPDIVEYRGLVALRSGDPRRAIDFLLRANMMDAPGFRRSLYLAEAYAALEQWPAAVKWYEQAVRLDPTDRRALDGLEAARQGHLP